MTKKWEKKQDYSFVFSVDGMEAGTLRFLLNNLDKQATFTLGEQTFAISRKGIWKSTLVISDGGGNEVASVYAQKWYAHTWVLEYGGKTYQLAVRNNPLAEYVVTDGKNELLVYGLHSNAGKIQVKIKDQSSGDDYFLHFLLWFLFAPVATENTGDDLSFLLLMA